MSMFKQVADIRTADTLKLDVPDCDYQVVQVEATPFQQELVQELADRADAINAGNVDPTIDNMLKITSDGRKLGLDPRLIDPSFEDNPDTKLNRCVENVARIHAETTEDRLTQIIFCDLGVPHKAAEAAVEGEDADDAKDKKSIAEVESLEEECDFCVYDDIRDKLIAKGIPAEEIAYIHDAKTEQQKADLFDNINSNYGRFNSCFFMPPIIRGHFFCWSVACQSAYKRHGSFSEGCGVLLHLRTAVRAITQARQWHRNTVLGGLAVRLSVNTP